MCGIYSCLNYIPEQGESLNDSDTYRKHFHQFLQIAPRGPDHSSMKYHAYIDALIGFHRLSINGLDMKSNQPMYDKNNTIILICNGQIYNHNELFDTFQFKRENNSDCEIIIHLYKQFGIDYTLRLLDGVFAFMLFDLRNDDSLCFVARDPFGVRPLFIGKHFNEYYFASECKALTTINEVKPCKPGSYYLYERKKLYPVWNYKENNSFFSLPISSIFPLFLRKREYTMLEYGQRLLRNLVISAVEKRVRNTDRPIACLLSGGLDSSLVAAITSSIFKAFRKAITYLFYWIRRFRRSTLRTNSSKPY